MTVREAHREEIKKHFPFQVEEMYQAIICNYEQGDECTVYLGGLQKGKAYEYYGEVCGVRVFKPCTKLETGWR